MTSRSEGIVNRLETYKYKHDKVIDEEHTYNYNYNENGQLHTLIYPSGFGVTYSYVTGKLSSIHRSDNGDLIYRVRSRNKYRQPIRCEYGNSVATEYDEILIDEILYTFNPNSTFTQYAKVKFEYRDLPDNLGRNTYFVASGKIQQTNLLKAITVYYGNTTVRKYEFNYNLNDPGERTAHLKEVVLSEYNENGTEQKLKPTAIIWGEKNSSIDTSSLSNFSTKSILTGDFNGDGYTDIVVYESNPESKTWELYLFNPSTNTYNSTPTTTNTFSTRRDVTYYAQDINGDGKDELIVIVESRTNPTLFYSYSIDNGSPVQIHSLEVDNLHDLVFKLFKNGRGNHIIENSAKKGTKKYILTYKYDGDNLKEQTFGLDGSEDREILIYKSYDKMQNPFYKRADWSNLTLYQNHFEVFVSKNNPLEVEITSPTLYAKIIDKFSYKYDKDFPIEMEITRIF